MESIRNHIERAIAQAIREKIPQYNKRMSQVCPSNPDYFGEDEIIRVIERFRQLYQRGNDDH